MGIKQATLAAGFGLLSLISGEFYTHCINANAPSPTEVAGHAHNIAERTAVYPVTFLEVAADRYSRHGDPVSAAAGAGVAIGAAGVPIGFCMGRKKKKKE